MERSRLAGMKGIKLKGKLTLEIDQDVCAEDLGRLLGSSKKHYEEDYSDDYYSSYKQSLTPPQPIRRPPWLDGQSNQRQSNPNFYPISAGLASYRE